VPPGPSRNGSNRAATGPLHVTDRLGPGPARHDTAVAGPNGFDGPPTGTARPVRRPGPPPAGARPGPTGRRPRTARQRRRRSTLIITLVILLLGLAAGVGAWWFASGRYSKVPDVSGEPRTTAQSALHRAGFDQIPISTEYSESVAKDAVIRTDPPSGSELTRDKTITLVVSSGKERFTVPDVRNGGLAAAQATLAKLPVRVSVARQPSDAVPPGQVVGTDPANGTQVRRGQTVRLLVSSGPPIIAVPDVTGQSQDDATKALTAAGFKVAVRQDFSDSVDEGQVLAQQPGGNSQAAKSSTVTIVVSQGPVLITVPDIPAGTSTADARTQLESLGLKVKVNKHFGGLLGQLVGLNPPAGSQLPRGDTVTLDVV
jgi:serine/threonine-protein kinase